MNISNDFIHFVPSSVFQLNLVSFYTKIKINKSYPFSIVLLLFLSYLISIYYVKNEFRFLFLVNEYENNVYMELNEVNEIQTSEKSEVEPQQKLINLLVL
jgi:hypothetical protein